MMGEKARRAGEVKARWQTQLQRRACWSGAGRGAFEGGSALLILGLPEAIPPRDQASDFPKVWRHSFS